MNILYIDHYAGSPKMGMEFRPYYLAREWVKRGHDVTIIAGDYSHLRRENPNVREDFQEEIIDGIRYLWVQTGEYEGNGVARALTMFRFTAKLMKHAGSLVKRFHPDAVIASSTYPLDSYPAKKIARKAGARYIHEVHDLWPATLYEIGGMSKNHPFVVLLQIAENHAYKSCDALVSLLGGAKEYMMQHGLAGEKFHYLGNGVVLEEWQGSTKMPEPHRELLGKLHEEGRFIVGYFGGHALSNNLGHLLDVAEAMKDREDIAFVLVGDGVEKPRLTEDAERRGLRNVHFLPPIAKDEVPDLVSCFDIVFITAKDSPLYRYGVSMNKMFDAMMAGVPVVEAIDAPSTPISEADAGITVPPEDTEAAVQAVERFASMDAEERRAYGRRGQESVKEHHNYEKLALEFEKLFS